MVCRYTRLMRPEQEVELSLLFALLLIGLPTLAVLFDFFTGGEAVAKLGRQNRLQQISTLPPPA